jgi:hypothetical protein
MSALTVEFGQFSMIERRYAPSFSFSLFLGSSDAPLQQIFELIIFIFQPSYCVERIGTVLETVSHLAEYVV